MNIGGSITASTIRRDGSFWRIEDCVRGVGGQSLRKGERPVLAA